MSLFFCAANFTMKFLLVTLSRWRVQGKENVPRTGPLIIVANHLSLADPPLLGASVPRRITFMAKEELFQGRLARFVMEGYGAFPVRRGRLHRDGLMRACRTLQNGAALGMFPEGKRSADARLQSPQPGVAHLAARSGAPLLPVGIIGTEHVRGIGFILKRPRITVTIGRPFLLPSAGGKPSRSMLDEDSRLIMERIAELLPERYRGAYGPGADSGGAHGN